MSTVVMEKVKWDGEKGDGIEDSCIMENSPSLVSDISNETKPCANLGRTSGPSRRSSKGLWTNEEDELLTIAVGRYSARSWKKIAACIPNRTDTQCLHRWQKVLDPELIKGAWTKEEDDKIKQLVKKHGTKNWSAIAKSIKGRIGKQCRERSDNSIKNHWNCSLKKRLDTNLAFVLPDHRSGIGTADLNIHATQARCPKLGPAKENIDNQIRADQRLTSKHFLTSNMDVVHHPAIAERLNLDLQLVLPADSTCLRIEKQPSPIGNTRSVSGEVEPILDEDPKCTSLESRYHKPFNESLGRSHEDGFERDGLDPRDETASSSLRVYELTEIIRVEDDSDAPTTPPNCANGNIGPLCDSFIELMDIEGSISSKSPCRSEDYAQKTQSPIHCSTSPSLSFILSSMMTTIRSRAKNFEIPSIIRKRGRDSSGTLIFGNEKDFAEVDDAMEFAHHKWSNDDVDCSGGDNLNDKFSQFSHEYSTHEASETTKSVARRLEGEFDMEDL